MQRKTEGEFLIPTLAHFAQHRRCGNRKDSTSGAGMPLRPPSNSERALEHGGEGRGLVARQKRKGAARALQPRLRRTPRRKRKGRHRSPLREECLSSRPQEGQDADPAAVPRPTAAAAGSDREL